MKTKAEANKKGAATKKTANRKKVKTAEMPEEISELGMPIWAVLDGINVFGVGLTYPEAEECVVKHPTATITTAIAALRLQN